MDFSVKTLIKNILSRIRSHRLWFLLVYYYLLWCFGI